MRTWAIVRRILMQFKRDKRSLALMIVAPLFVLTLLWLVLDSEELTPDIALVDTPAPFALAVEEQDANVKEMTLEDAHDQLAENELDALISWEEQTPRVVLEGSDPSANSAVLRILREAGAQLSEGKQLNPDVEFLHGSNDFNLFDNVGPVLVGFFVFFFVFIVGGVSFLRERTQGTLERLLSTPLKRGEIVTGYLIGFGIFTIVQSVIIAAYSIFALDMFMSGSFFYVLLVTFLLALAALSLGTLLSSYAKNEFQMIQFIPLVIVPQVFFSGIFNLETMEPWLRAIGKVMPLTYGAEALRDIMIRGQGFESFQLQIYVLGGFTVLFALLNMFALKRHRRL
ncbi:ABC transporter permease [Thalassobacillus sp. CUG 92003]|uniref:ABC transporter permease n=1 Tax=Thalassobacillus sp. CUG 92003 TaxID=2736641 RepID=UPI0015E75FE0|nr:ABC transporter permease [Thalassobacillus sp. CUG 92003]